MNLQQIDQILQETAYVRTGGSPEELKCAEYLVGKCKEMGLEAYLESFEVDMADISQASLTDALYYALDVCDSYAGAFELTVSGTLSAEEAFSMVQ